MEINNKYLQGLLNQSDSMLMPDEKSLCSVYCVFKPTSFFAGFLHTTSSTYPGFISITDRKRVLIVRQKFFGNESAVYDLTTISNFKITNMPLKQKALSMVFLENGKKVKVKLQAAEKVIGNGFPEQADNLEHLIVLLSRHGA